MQNNKLSLSECWNVPLGLCSVDVSVSLVSVSMLVVESSVTFYGSTDSFTFFCFSRVPSRRQGCFQMYRSESDHSDAIHLRLLSEALVRYSQPFLLQQHAVPKQNCLTFQSHMCYALFASGVMRGWPEIHSADSSSRAVRITISSCYTCWASVSLFECSEQSNDDNHNFWHL